MTRRTSTGEVKSDGARAATSANGGTSLSLQNALGILDRVEGNVAEALEVTSLHVGGETDARDLASVAEEGVDGVLVDVEGEVADEESVGLGAQGITVGLSAVIGTLTGVGLGGTSIGVVKVQGTTVNLLALHGLVGSDASLGGTEVNVAEATAAASVLVHDDTSANKAIEVLESLPQSVVVNTPAEAASEESGGLSLGLLGSLIDLSIGLALLGGSLGGLGLGLSLIRGLLIGILLLVRVRRVRVGVSLLGLIRVIAVGLGLLYLVSARIIWSIY